MIDSSHDGQRNEEASTTELNVRVLRNIIIALKYLTPHTVWAELELEELVAKLARVSNVVSGGCQQHSRH